MKVRTVKIYEANVGKTFESKEACQQYESEPVKLESLAKLKQKVDKIEHILNSCAPFGYSYVDTERYEYCWFKPKDSQEVADLFTYFNIDMNESSDTYENKWLEFEIDGDYDDYSGAEDVYFLGSPEDSFQQLKEFYASCGYKIGVE